MSLAREDMLRELELLPVWRLRAPVDANTLPESIVLAPKVLTPVTPATESLVEKTADALPGAIMIEPAIIALSADDSPIPVLTTETEPLEVISESLIESPWLLLCPQVSDAAAQQLLQNIVHALKLPSETLHISDQEVKVTQVKSRFCILFGLQAANTFFGTNHADIASIRGQLLTHSDLRYVVTHHPDAMLENPLLKKEVWHDLCLLLAEKQN